MNRKWRVNNPEKKIITLLNSASATNVEMAPSAQTFVPYNLNHFFRDPVNFRRIPEHLWHRIVQKQAAKTQLNLGLVCSGSSRVVQEVIEEIPHLAKIKTAIKLVTKARLLHPAYWAEYFPPKSGITFRDWINGFIVNMRFTALHKANRLLAKELWKMQQKDNFRSKPLAEKWKAEGLHGPGWIDLNPVPKHIWQKLLIKTSYVSMTRLASTCRISKAEVLFYISQSQLLNAHVADARKGGFWMEEVDLHSESALKVAVRRGAHNSPTFFADDGKKTEFQNYAIGLYLKQTEQREIDEDEEKKIYKSLGYTSFESFAYVHDK